MDAVAIRELTRSPASAVSNGRAVEELPPDADPTMTREARLAPGPNGVWTTPTSGGANSRPWGISIPSSFTTLPKTTAPIGPPTPTTVPNVSISGSTTRTVL